MEKKNYGPFPKGLDTDLIKSLNNCEARLTSCGGVIFIQSIPTHVEQAIINADKSIRKALDSVDNFYTTEHK